MALTRANERRGKEQRDTLAKLYKETGGNVSEISRRMGVSRGTVQGHMRKAGLYAKPIMGGSMRGTVAEDIGTPPKGKVRRFLLTAAQNNTPLNERMWASLNALARHYEASIMVGTYTYNTNAYGKLAVKRGTAKERVSELWYDPRLEEHIVDRRVELGNGLVWCGEMNILPTAVDPLSGLETYSHRKSSIFPHAQLAMRSIPTMQGEWAKLNYTTGTVTQHNYIQKKEGLKAEHHHSYSALLVEVNDKGNWWVRQVHSDSKTGEMRDLDVCADGDKVTTGNRVEAITWGDLHATMVDPGVQAANMDMLAALAPKVQFLHDILEGASINRHERKHKDNHAKFRNWLRGLHRLEKELLETAAVVQDYVADDSHVVVVDSNHDGWWLKSWLKDFDYRVDPGNAELFLDLQRFFYAEIRAGKDPKDVNVMEEAMLKSGLEPGTVQFLLPDEGYTICGKKIECGMHGHLGPNGAFGSPAGLKNVGRRANTAHTHSAGIYHGLYVAGTSSRLKWNYNYGPSSWNHSHVVTYPNGARSIVTLYLGMWRA